MIQDTQTHKPDVINPTSSLWTVGQELVSAFKANGKDVAVLGITKLSEREHISKKKMLEACAILGVDSSFAGVLTNIQEDYAEKKRRSTAAYKKALSEYRALRPATLLLRGEFNEGYDRLEDVLDFFGTDDAEEIMSQTSQIGALFRQQNDIKVNAINLHAWLRRGEIDFTAMALPQYDEIGLKQWIDSREWERHVEDAEYFKKIPEILKPYGVGVVLVPFLPHTVYGAVRWIDNRPMVEISDRNKDLATCWFTLFHELGHVICHRDTEVLEGRINDKEASRDRREREANKFANHYLSNGDELRKTVFDRKRAGQEMTAKTLADEFGVNKMFTAYWLLKAQYNPTLQQRKYIDFSEKYQ